MASTFAAISLVLFPAEHLHVGPGATLAVHCRGRQRKGLDSDTNYTYLSQIKDGLESMITNEGSA